MSDIAIVVNNIVAVVYRDAAASDIADPPAGAHVVEAASGVVVAGMSWADGVFGPPPSIPMSAAELRAYAADKRWRVETGGVPFSGLRLPTDDRAKTLIMGAAGAMTDAATAPFVVGSTVVTLTGAQFKAAHQSIVAHVQACFATQVAVLAAIDAGTITTTAQIDAAAWPPNQ